MISWFRDDGGPVFYSYSNRTSVTGDIDMVACGLVFLTLYTAFLIIFPGIRKQRFATFITVTLSLFTGNAIMMTKIGSSWHVGHAQILSTYCAFSVELIEADLGVYIGLDHVNITFRALSEENSSKIQEIDFNERFNWHGVHEMSEHYQEALVRGLPYPILTIAEYFSHSKEGFCWGAEYRAAGYYCSILLWAALAAWFMMNLLLLVVPRYGAYAMVIMSAFQLLSCIIYDCMLPVSPLVIKFEENQRITFSFGWCYWLNLFSGLMSGAVGIIITCVDLIYPHQFSIVLEVDYDTPYDRHIIIEDSHYNRRKGSISREGEQSVSIGRRILRQLSLKMTGPKEKIPSIEGVVKCDFESESSSTSLWRYVYQRPAVQDIRFNETSSQDSSPTAMVTSVEHNQQSLYYPFGRRNQGYVT